MCIAFSPLVFVSCCFHLSRIPHCMHYRYLPLHLFLPNRKIKEDARRGNEIHVKKQQIINTRKQMAIQARIQRDRIIESMELIRRNKQWNKVCKNPIPLILHHNVSSPFYPRA